MYESEQSALEAAMDEAERFLKAGQAALDEQVGGRWGNKHNAAAKRSSMDLTRALAEYRGITRREA